MQDPRTLGFLFGRCSYQKPSVFGSLRRSNLFYVSSPFRLLFWDKKTSLTCILFRIHTHEYGVYCPTVGDFLLPTLFHLPSLALTVFSQCYSCSMAFPLPITPSPRSFPNGTQACVIPRPIGWISTLSSTGTPNLAPYSQFNNLTFDPPYVMFAANQTATDTQKDTTVNVEATGVFCWNLATYELRDAVNISAEQVDSSVDEFERAGLETEESTIVEVLVKGGKKRVPMVRSSPIKFECAYYSTIRLPGNPPMGSVSVVIGRVIGVHIDDGVLTDGRIDVSKTVPIARCGYFQYAAVREVFEMRPLGDDPNRGAGLEGSIKGNRNMQKDRETEGGAQNGVEEDAKGAEPKA
jgi:flavin reductase (DIM6/NTAB) family NADH-FMN oxidoreductase RutF